MGGGSNTPLVFTVPSRPVTGQQVAFVARAADLANTARVEIWINGRRMKASADSVCLYTGGPFPAGMLHYGAKAVDKTGHEAWTGFLDLRIEAVDRTPPTLSVFHRPAQPRTNQRVTFIARAKDPSGVARIDLVVNGKTVQTSAGETCSYVGGPFPQGMVTYGAQAYDTAGNRASAGHKELVVVPAQPLGNSTITGQLTGKWQQAASGARAYSLDQPALSFSARADTGGRYRIVDLPDGRYHVAPAARGKWDVISEPRSRTITCHGQQTYTVNFHVTGIMEG